MNVYEIYAEARRLGSRLRDQGLTAEAEEIEGAIRGGSTSGEILMGIRFHLMSGALRADEVTRAAITTLVDTISELLDP